MKIKVDTDREFIEGIEVNFRRPDGTIKKTTIEGTVVYCEHDDITEETGEPYAICDDCDAVGNYYLEDVDYGWNEDGTERVIQMHKDIAWDD